MIFPNKKNIIFLKIGLFALMCFAFFVLLPALINYNRVTAGVRVSGVALGLKKYDEAELELKLREAEFLSQKIVLRYQDWRLEIVPEDAGARLNIARTMEEAYKIGRSGAFSGIGRRLWGFVGKYDVVAEIDWDEKQFEVFYEKNLAGLDNYAENAAIVFKNNLSDFTIIPGKKGAIVNKRKLINDILNRTLFLSAASIDVEISEDEPEVTEIESEIAMEIINKIRDVSPFVLYVEDRQWKVTEEEIMGLLYFPAEYPDEIREYYESEKLNFYDKNNKIMGVGLDEKKTKDFFTGLVAVVNREPVNAELRFQNSQVTLFALSRDGIKLNVGKSADIFEKSVKYGRKEISLDYEKTEPEITTDNIDNLGITSLIGKGSSNFFNSPNSREHNIKVGAQKFHGVLLKPGEEFSFNKILGNVGSQTGYLPELVIKDKKMVMEYGGGLCQVSTTVFRAAINSGMKITERFAHAFPVVYYSPQGFDATIYPPHPDLRFINDTSGHLLVQAKLEGSNLTFEFYGTDDGRKVRVIGPEQYDVKPDGSMKARLFQEIYGADGELIRSDVFYSNYKSPSLYPVEKNPLE